MSNVKDCDVESEDEEITDSEDSPAEDSEESSSNDGNEELLIIDG
jgi:hypothetical protein